MKKLIGIIAIIIGLYSCGNAPVDVENVLIVTKIKQGYSLYCNYYGNNQDVLMGESYWRIIDTCGKWNVGDTIKLQ